MTDRQNVFWAVVFSLALTSLLYLYSPFHTTQILIEFDSDLSATEIRRYLTEKQLTITNSESLINPVRVLISFHPDFEQTSRITVEEVNDFLLAISNEPYVQDVDVALGWAPTIGTTDVVSRIQRVDRWGYFTLTFAELESPKEFFKKYPEATFFAKGTIQGTRLTHEDGKSRTATDHVTITILYKADKAMQALNPIKQEIMKSGVSWQEKEIDDSGQILKRPILFLGEYLGKTTFGIHFPSSYSRKKILELLRRYAVIDTDKTLINRLNWVQVRVPNGKEKYWIQELSKSPFVRFVGPLIPPAKPLNRGY